MASRPRKVRSASARARPASRRFWNRSTGPPRALVNEPAPAAHCAPQTGASPQCTWWKMLGAVGQSQDCPPPTDGSTIISCAPPVYRHLDQTECEAVLRRQHVGRLAFLSSNRVDIEPIHYVFSDRWIFGRTSEGTKVQALEHRP